MLFEQINKFELREPGPPGCIWTPVAGYFYDKTKISKENLWVDYYFGLLLQYCIKQGTFFPLPRQIRKFNFKMQDFNRVWTYLVS